MDGGCGSAWFKVWIGSRCIAGRSAFDFRAITCSGGLHLSLNLGVAIKIPEAKHQLLPGLSQPAIIAAGFLAFHLLLVFWRPNPFWGADFLWYTSGLLKGFFILLAVLLLIPGFRTQVRTWFCALPITLWDKGRRTWLTRLAMLIVALVAFVGLSSELHLLGDGYLYLRELDADIWQRMDRAPLTFTLIRLLHSIGSGFWETAENTYRIYSFASGVLYVLLTFPVAAALGKSPQEKSIALAFLLTAGYVQLFFGYVENYALYMPGTLLYLLLGLRTMENRLPLHVPALLLGMLVPLHLAFAVFAPSLLILAYLNFRNRQRGNPRYKSVLAISAALCFFPLSAVLFLYLTGVEFVAYLSQKGSHFLPVFTAPGFYAPYRLFSLPHFLDFINLQLLSAPAVCMTFFLLRKKDFGHQSFLLSAAAFPLLFTFFANPEIGAFRDWDILALPALPLTLWAAPALLARIRESDQRFHSAFLICAAAGLHTLLWVGLNASGGSAEARYIHQVGKLSGHASSYGWDTLGSYYHQQNKSMEALSAYKQAINANPKNPRHWVSLGLVHLEQGRNADAIEHLKRAVELQPDLAAAHGNLGAAYSEIGQYIKAIEYLNRAIELQPDLAGAHVNLGAAYKNIGKPANAIEHLNRAIELQPDLAGAHVNLGAVYSETGQYPIATKHLQKALELQPDNAVVFLNLGATSYYMGQDEKAVPYLKKAIQIDPNLTNAYLSLGLAYLALKRMDEAEANFQKVLKLDPNGPMASRAKQFLEETRSR